MTINTTCPLCHETIGDRAMKIEPVLAEGSPYMSIPAHLAASFYSSTRAPR